MNLTTEEKILKKLNEHDNLFVEIKDDMAEMFGYMRDTFATKDDLKNFATKDDLKNFATKDDFKLLENKMEEGFSSIRSELRSINERLEDLENRMESLERMAKEDLDILVKDFLELKHKVIVMEKALRAKGILFVSDSVT